MKNKVILLCALSLFAISISPPDTAFAKSKHWTITERQEALSTRVAKGEKSNELTLKEADKFRSRLQDVNDSIEKCKSKNGGKLSYKDQGKVEKTLNSISLDLEKKELDKRVQAK